MMKNFYQSRKNNQLTLYGFPQTSTYTRVKLATQQVIIFSTEPEHFSAFEVIIIYDKFKVILFNSFSIVEISTASPSGMQITSLRNHGQIYNRNVTCYPNQHQIGQQLFCFVARDSAG